MLEGFIGARGYVVWVSGDKCCEEGHRAWIGFDIFIRVILTTGICWELIG